MNKRLFLGPVISLSALMAGAALLSPAVAAGGTTLKQYGWWNIAVYDPTLGNPTYPGPDGADMHVAYGPNPDAAEKQDVNGLVVNGPTQVSAAEWDLATAVPDGTSPDIQVATITVPVDTTYTPAVSPQASVMACPALNPWQPVEGGNWQARVTYDAGSACAPGNFDSGKNVFTFNITAGMLRNAQFIDLAFVPGFVPLGCDVQNNPSGCAPNPSAPPQAPWTIDLQAPTAGDVVAQPVMSGGLGAQFALPQDNSGSVPTLGSSLPGGLAAAPAPMSQGPGGSVAQPVNRVPTSVAANPAARLDALGRGRLLAAGLLLLLFLGGLLLMGMDVQKLMTPAGQTAGIGRFARPRTGPALPI